MRSYSFAILFGMQSDPESDATPVATHLPLVVKDEGEHGLIEGHFARANRHWQCPRRTRDAGRLPRPAQLRFADALYRSALRAHLELHRRARLRHLGTGRRRAGQRCAARRPDRAERAGLCGKWRNLPEGFRRTLLAGIVGIRIPIARIEGKFKISQNLEPQERRNVHDAQAAGTPDQQSLAAWMQRLIPVEPLRP